MLRFSNYWVQLFNVKKLQPFIQFIKPQEFLEHKLKVTRRVQELLLGADATNRGQLERCVSKISELTFNSGDKLISKETGVALSPSGRLRLTRDMVE